MKMLGFCLLSIFLLVALGPDSALSGVQHRTVSSTGNGSTLKDAINEALGEAIGRVNGISLETRSELNSVEVSTTNNNDHNYFSGEKYQKDIKAATKGIVAAYEILEQKEIAPGQWQVSLSAQVAVYQRSHASDRKRIAVIPFRVSDNPFMIEGVPANKGNVSRIMAQNVVSSLVQSRRFTVLDREYIREILGEKKLLESQNTPMDQMVRLGQDLVADYILTGTLEDVSFATSTVQMQTSGRSLTTRQGNVVFSYRILDIDTGQVLFSDFLKLSVGDKEIRQAGSGPTMEATLCMLAAEQIGKTVLNAIYPILVVSVQDGSVTLGQGGMGIKVGDRFDVFEYGKRLVDPYTKEFIGNEETYVATIEVTRVNPKQSHAKIIRSEKNLAANFAPKKFVCRASFDAQREEQKAREDRTKEREARKKKHDEDW